MDRLVEVESIAEEMSKVLYRYAMQLDCPGDVMEALRRWEIYEKAVADGA